MPFIQQFEPATLILLLYCVAGGVLVLLGLPLYFGKVPPNQFYGFRTPQTMGDDKVWYAVNRVTGRGMVLTGTATIAVANWLQWRGWDPYDAARVDLAVFVCGVLLTLCVSVFATRRSP
jgi:uncharacterized membrane protein